VTQTQFIAQVRALAAEVPGVNPEAAAAHAANESAFGQSGLALKANNLWGVKATGQYTPYWQGDFVEMPTWEVRDGVNVQELARFRRYPSWREAVGDYADIAARVYPWAVQHADHPLGWLTGLFLIGPAKWATDPKAFQKCVAILDKFDLWTPSQRERLGWHVVLVDNSPTVAKGVTTIAAALSRRPAVHGPHLATRTRRPDGSWKLDVREAPEEEE